MSNWRALAMQWVAASVLLGGCGSLFQTEGRVERRDSGGSLHDWASVQDAAKEHWPYAWAAVAAYQDADDPGRQDVHPPPECPNDDAHAFLKGQGWVLWDTLPLLKPHDSELAPYSKAGETMRKMHLRVEVWSHQERREVAVAFGGTVGSNAEDWKTNLHWLLSLTGPRKDEYDAIAEYFVPVFEKEYGRRRREDPAFGWLSDPATTVYVTGHSLGGGLAQRFAYEVWFTSAIPFGKKVYAFDPSPVSTKRSSQAFKDHRNEDKPFKGLKIYRVYNRGEILATLRSVLSWGKPDPDTAEQGQNWIDIRYKDDWSLGTVLPAGAVHAHGMYGLACFMKVNLPAGTLATAAPGK